jgi:hypothetical protein
MAAAKNNPADSSAKEDKDLSNQSTRVEGVAYRNLTEQAKKYGVSKSKYASAAINYFAQLGLDPTAEASQGLGEIGAKVSAETLAVRKQNVDIGNRFISIIRTWEANLYGFMKQQELAQNTYLAAIERNLLERMVAMETTVLAPMAEQIIKAALESYVGRFMSERTYLKVIGREQTQWEGQHKQLSDDRDKLLLKAVEEYTKLHPNVVTTVTPKPALTLVPAKPVAPSAVAAPAPATQAPAGPPKP